MGEDAAGEMGDRAAASSKSKSGQPNCRCKKQTRTHHQTPFCRLQPCFRPIAVADTASVANATTKRPLNPASFPPDVAIAVAAHIAAFHVEDVENAVVAVAHVVLHVCRS